MGCSIIKIKAWALGHANTRRSERRGGADKRHWPWVLVRQEENQERLIFQETSEERKELITTSNAAERSGDQRATNWPLDLVQQLLTKWKGQEPDTGIKEEFSQRFWVKMTQWLRAPKHSLDSYFWPRWSNRDQIYLPAWTTKNSAQNKWNCFQDTGQQTRKNGGP